MPTKYESRTTTVVEPNANVGAGDDRLPPVHPGEILREDFLAEMGVSLYRLAKATGMPIQRVSAVVNERRAITGDTALRLGRYFGVDPQWWMNMQAHFDLEVARRQLGSRLDEEVVPLAAAS